MAYASVGDAKHSANNSNVKTISGNVERRRWRRKAEPQSPVVERSPYPNPAGDTQILQQVTQRPAAASLPPLHRDQSTNPDVVAVRMVRVLSQCLDEHWSATQLQDALLMHSGELHRRAMREQEGGATIARRVANGHRTSQETAEAIEAAVRVEQVTGVKVPLDPQAMGRGMARAAANAHDLSERTMVGLPRITDDMPDPRVQVSVTTVTVSKPASPVHVPGDGTHAALPDEDETADPGAHEPLPQRAEPVNVLPATDADPSTAVDPTSDDAGLAYGSWIFDEGGGVTGPVWFKLMRRHVEGDGVVRLDYCSGLHVDVRKGRQVRVLDPVRAKELLAQAEAKRAERAS